MILAQRKQLTLARSEVTVGRLEIERLKLMLAKARREQFGQSSERGKLSIGVGLGPRIGFQKGPL